MTYKYKAGEEVELITQIGESCDNVHEVLFAYPNEGRELLSSEGWDTLTLTADEAAVLNKGRVIARKF